jgi:hypothetical protein
MQPPRRMEDIVERQSGRVPIAPFGELPRDALLTAGEVGEWLKIAPRQVQRLGMPWIDLGRKTPRYQVKDVLAWLETRRREGDDEWLHLAEFSAGPRTIDSANSAYQSPSGACRYGSPNRPPWPQRHSHE